MNNKYLIGEHKDSRIDMRFRRGELNKIQEELTEVYPDFDEWMHNSVNRFFFKEIANTAIARFNEEK